MLAPTKKVAVLAVVANGGDVSEHGVVVRAELVATKLVSPPRAGKKASKAGAVRLPGPEQVSVRVGTLQAGGSRDLTLPSLRVRSGVVYRLQVTITGLPAGPGMSDSESVRIEVAR
ncbi:MAG TPA: hypothetical protein VFN50_04430 [Acidimicrobiales bacterium]|nr:hypothetical protein [Acidimicrobiales bacterium]